MRSILPKTCRRSETEACYSVVTKIGMTPGCSGVVKGSFVAKDKKKKKKKDSSASDAAAKVTKRLRDISRNPLVADIVAATLVGAAAALKDSKKAQRLASDAGKDLEDLAQKSAQRGNVLWQLALDVGRQSLEALAGDEAPKARKAKPKPKPKAKAAKPAKAKVGTASRSRTTKAPKSAKSKAS